jgi:hypothetical protein
MSRMIDIHSEVDFNVIKNNKDILNLKQISTLIINFIE